MDGSHTVKDKIEVLVVDDSPTIRRMLVNLLTASPCLIVTGEARDGAEAVRLTHRLKPDVISMDIHMPVMDGFEATREIMRTQPTPIVVVSGSFEHSELDVAFDAIQAGALAVLQKPPTPDHPDYTRCRDELVATIEAMSDVVVIHHRPPQVRTGPLTPLLNQHQALGVHQTQLVLLPVIPPPSKMVMWSCFNSRKISVEVP